MVAFLITALVTAISLVIISKLPFIGVEIDSLWKAGVAGIILGILNAFVKPIINILSLPLYIVTLGLFWFVASFVINAIVFGLAAWLVQGFRLRNGIISALLGAVALGIINSILFSVLSRLGL